MFTPRTDAPTADLAPANTNAAIRDDTSNTLFPLPPRPTSPSALPPEQPYGDGIGPKADGVYRLAYGNIDGFPTVPYNNPKAGQLKEWLQNIDADFFAGNEAKINWSRMPRSGQLPELFRTENALRSIAALQTQKRFAVTIWWHLPTHLWRNGFPGD
jgi:hypothetical protein